MAGAQNLQFNNFTGGQASIFPLNAMPPKYSMRMQNCHITGRGSIGKVPGYEKVNANSINLPLTNGFEFRKSDGTTIMLAAGSGNIYKHEANGSLTAIKQGLGPGANVSFTSINDICIMANGVDAPMKYDGAAVSALGGTPPAKGSIPHVHKGRVWLLDKDAMMAYYSALDAPEDWTTAQNAGYIDFKFMVTSS